MKKLLPFLLSACLFSGLTQANPFHPDFTLKTEQNENWQPGETLSQSATCGHCHDTSFISSSLDVHHHQNLNSPASFRQLLDLEQTAPSKGELQCLACHNPQRQKNLEQLADNNGVVTGKNLNLTSPSSEACGTCHGLVQVNSSQPLSLPKEDSTGFAATGEIFSDQLISRSALNIANKQQLQFSFDAHAERVVGCTDCHASPNNPNAPQQTNDNKQLKYDPRTLSAHDYLEKPDHHFTRARECTTCHEVKNNHDWLPYLNQHLSKLSCESCHANWLPAPAWQKVNLHTKEVELRGVDNKLITGYSPWLLPNAHGKLAPFNLIEVSDNNTSQLVTKAVHHGIQSEMATRECSDCHSKNSILLREVPALAGTDFRLNEHNQLNLHAAGIYLIGADTHPWIDWLGLAIVLGTFLGVAGHGFARYLAARKLGAHKIPRKRVYMYTYYERLWHWLQAATIIALLLTGAAIHKPWMFSWLSFKGMVEVHNILGVILFVNAALALFYHLASGEIKQYIPMPSDLFVRTFEQVQFYLKGIFTNEPHPFEKNREQKLNPLQKIAYFGLLNALLPAQMFTGILMWGAQTWPAFAEPLGGLTILGPLHSFLAWVFVSFLIMHIYLTTTSGPKPLSGIKAMIDGWEDVEAPPEGSNHD